ncbi:MAG: GspH/FimT family pseudopilin [Neisseriaceae bacterium]|nr:GspH/FimT family pseudopilin [Neisseriaceae bacterium]
MKRTHLKQRGFTLTELMIVVAIAAIFATLAVPNMGGMIARQRVQGQANEIANALTFAHTEAVRRGKPVFVVPGQVNDNGKLQGTATDWDEANALLVFADDSDATKNKNVQGYDTGEDLRVVSLNKQIKLAEISKEELGKDVGKSHEEDWVFAYYPNGQMRIGKIDGGEVSVTEPPGAIGRIMLTDKNRKTKDGTKYQASRFCEVIRLDATGRSTIYTGKRSELKDGDFFYCAYN